MSCLSRVVVVLFAAAAIDGSAIADGARSGARLDPSWKVLQLGLASRDYSDRLLTTQVLGELRGTEDWIARSLSDPEHDVRVAAVDALKHVGSSRAAQLLRRVRDDASEKLDIRVLAAAALLQLGTAD
jgi:HEAT repeat protein